MLTSNLSYLRYITTLPGPGNDLAAYLLAVGMVLFSGSIYLRVICAPDVSSNNEIGENLFGFAAAMTPLGVVILMGGWGLLAFSGP